MIDIEELKDNFLKNLILYTSVFNRSNKSIKVEITNKNMIFKNKVKDGSYYLKFKDENLPILTVVVENNICELYDIVNLENKDIKVDLIRIDIKTYLNTVLAFKDIESRSDSSIYIYFNTLTGFKDNQLMYSLNICFKIKEDDLPKQLNFLELDQIFLSSILKDNQENLTFERLDERGLIRNGYFVNFNFSLKNNLDLLSIFNKEYKNIEFKYGGLKWQICNIQRPA